MAKVGIVMGSDSDMPIMSKAADVLAKLGVEFEMTIISAHREPDVFFEYAESAESKGFKVIIAGAGKAAHLPGMCAAIFPLPVIGIPMKTSDLGGVDSLYSIVQMPTGIPVATVAINGGANAGILAAKILAASDPELLERLKKYSEDMKEEAELYHTELIEKICELDDDLMMQYLEGEEPSVDDLKAALRKGTCECKAVPVCCGTAYRNKGVQKLLDAIIEFMPAPTDIPAIKGVDEDGNEVERHSSDDEPFSALAFKIMTDPFVGKLAFFRVYSGTCKSGSYVLNATKNKKERVGRILQMHANKRAELDKVYSGDIAAAVGFKFTTTGDTICDEQHPVILESMEFPEPVIELAIEPKTKAGQGKMGEALAKLAEEDPTFRAHTDQETGQTIIAGMGELHLEIIVDRLLREFKVEANVGAPQVAYKETFTKPVDVEYKYAKQSGGRGQYGHCKVKFEPMDPNGEETFKFESTVVGGAIPKEYIPAVGEGIEEAAQAGILGGFPVLGVHANVYDGSYHEVDSSEMAFHIAGSMAFKEAMAKASPVLLEPIMKVEVTMPEEYMGDVIGDINSRRGRIEGMEDIGGGKMIRGYVPLSEMFGYSTDLRSRTQGRGNYSMFFEKYEQVPKSVQEKILSKKD